MKKAFIVTVSILTAVIIVMGIFLYNASVGLTSTTASLENLYQRSFYDLVNNVNNMEVEVSKLMVSNDSISQQKILSNLKQQTSDAENSLSLLPIDIKVLNEATKFINKLNGYCTSLINYQDGKVGEEEYSTINQVHQSLISIKNELNNIMIKIMNGYRISDNVGDGTETSNFSSIFSNFTSDTIDFPTLIYDGPFSEITTTRVLKGVGKEEVSLENAEKKIQELFGDSITDLNYLGETSSVIQAYDFSVNAGGRNYYIQITKQGGFLINMNGNINNSNSTKNKTDLQSKENSTDTEESIDIDSVDNVNEKVKVAIEKAKEFAKNQGLDNMECVWSASSESISYVNLAPMVDDIIMYPDLIKAKIDLNDNIVIGWEASSYAFNHVEREDLIAQLSLSEARKLVSNNLTIENERLCVIPLDFKGETLAYEFSGNYQGFKYYLYIDAYTGNQVRVLRIIQTDQGELVM